MHLGLPTYINELLQRHNMLDCNPADTPMVDTVLEPTTESNALSSIATAMYQSLVGGLLYVANMVRPDISFATNQLARFVSKPSDAHLKAAKRILRYLKGTASHGLIYSKPCQPDVVNQLVTYADAQYGGDALHNAKSISGAVVLLNGGPILWSSKRQLTIAMSSTEAEYVALSAVTKTLMFLIALCNDLGSVQALPKTIFEDNQGAIFIANNPVNSHRTRHINLIHHFIREQVQANTVRVVHCPTVNMLADIMTKPLARLQFEKFRDILVGIFPRL